MFRTTQNSELRFAINDNSGAMHFGKTYAEALQKAIEANRDMR